MDKKIIALFLIFSVAAADVSKAVQTQQLVKQLSGPQTRWDDFGTKADINQYVDDTIQLLVPFIQNQGLDPMDLPEVVEGFSVKFLLITYSAWLKIQEGYMNGLVNIDRSGEQSVSYFAKMLRVRLQVQFTNLEIFYNYLVKVMNIGPTGGIKATLNRFVVVIDVLVDFNNDEVQLQQFRLTDIGRLRVRLTGNILTDWLVNPVISTFVLIFDNIIIKVIESNIRSAIQGAIDSINTNISSTFEILETLNQRS